MSPRSEVLAYPPLSRAAEMVGVAPSTLSRRPDVQTIPVGDRDRRVPPSEVMRLSDLYKKVSINGVAADLIEYAHQHAPDHESAIQDQVDEYLSERPRSAQSMSVADFVTLARAELPKELAQAIAAALSSAKSAPKRQTAARRRATARPEGAAGKLVKRAATASSPVRKRTTARRAAGTTRRESSTTGKPRVTTKAAAADRSGRGQRTAQELEQVGTPNA